MLRAAILAAVCVTGIANASRAADRPDLASVFFDRCDVSGVQACPSDKDRFTYGSLAVVECWVGRDFLPKDQARYLEFARSTYRMKPYSAGTCVSLGVVPDELTRSAVKH